MGIGGLDRPVSVLRGVGPTFERRLARLGIRRIRDLLHHFPRDYQDRRTRTPLVEAAGRDRSAVLVRVRTRQWLGRGSRKALKVLVEDESGRAGLLCFGRPFLYSVLAPGKRFWLYGAFRSQRGELQASSFELEEYDEGQGESDFGRILPVYPSTEGLSQRVLRQLVAQAMELPELDREEHLPGKLLSRRRLLGRVEALRALHFPASWELLESGRIRLVYEEYLYEQLALQLTRRKRLEVERRRAKPRGLLRDALLSRLLFEMTEGQRRALVEIEADLTASRPAARLLQGEVGSGKTLVAILAALAVVESGEQVAYMAPTELLARQQADKAAGLLEPLGVRVAFLSGTLQGPAREELLRHLSAGSIDVVVGTHALYSPEVRYRRLGLAVVDEQQRFGVRQRQALLDKGDHPDLLLMTATPIPRTLALSAFGDLELSEIHDLPSGRKPVITHLARQGNERKVYERVRREIAAGGQAYFVYPLIEESESLQLKDAEGMYRTLQREVFPDLRMGLIHSRVPEEDKQRLMASFAAGGLDILVATSVMEVGVDVARATCIVIEHAERFGLSTLHQLRGRVGRGEQQSYAFLVYSRSLTESGIRRLRTIMSTTDGFRLAEEDLKIRGPGELLGFRQAGYLRSGLGDLQKDWETLIAARDDAREILEHDPGLLDPIHRGLWSSRPGSVGVS
jgi:ATP-dependent DNA helicase RecG